MFYKYASNILKDLSDKCLLKSFACGNEDDAKMYKSISERIDTLIGKIGVERLNGGGIATHD